MVGPRDDRPRLRASLSAPLARQPRRCSRPWRDLPSCRCARSTSSIPTSPSTWRPSRRALLERDGVVWQHPLYWYSVPALLKHWFDKVLARLGLRQGGDALHGKRCLWVDDHRRRPRRATARTACTTIRSTRSSRRSSRPRASAACAGSRRSSCTARSASSDAALAEARARATARGSTRAGAHEPDEHEHERVAAARRGRLPRRRRWCSCRSPSALGLGSVLGYLRRGLRRSARSGSRLVERRRVDPALRRVRRGADAVPDRARARPAAAVGDAPRRLRRRRAADGRCAARCSALACSLLGLPWQAALVAGLALALSSTAIAVQTMNERNLLAHAARAERASPSCCSRTSPRSR